MTRRLTALLQNPRREDLPEIKKELARTKLQGRIRSRWVKMHVEKLSRRLKGIKKKDQEEEED